MPQNEKFMYAAYAVATVAYLVYGASLWLRRRAIGRREAELDGVPAQRTERTT